VPAATKVIQGINSKLWPACKRASAGRIKNEIKKRNYFSEPQQQQQQLGLIHKLLCSAETPKNIAVLAPGETREFFSAWLPGNKLAAPGRRKNEFATRVFGICVLVV